MDILNLYSGIGGNRRLWSNEHNITAVEYDPQIAAVYQDLFPDDTVIVADAHQFLLEHYAEFDFIWSSPPCQSHSRIRYFRGLDPAYADIPAQKIERHLYWANFEIAPYEAVSSENLKSAQIPQLQKLHGVDLSKYKLKNKRQVLRNCVPAEIGNHILKSALETLDDSRDSERN